MDNGLTFCQLAVADATGLSFDAVDTGEDCFDEGSTLPDPNHRRTPFCDPSLTDVLRRRQTLGDTHPQQPAGQDVTATDNVVGRAYLKEKADTQQVTTGIIECLLLPLLYSQNDLEATLVHSLSIEP